jgi:hypothetical protein
MPRVGFEPTIPAFEPAKAFCVVRSFHIPSDFHPHSDDTIRAKLKYTGDEGSLQIAWNRISAGLLFSITDAILGYVQTHLN